MSKKHDKPVTSNVVDSISEYLADDCKFLDQLTQQIESRRLVSQLANLRNHSGVSQSDIAEHLKCNQSKISKLENGVDDSVTIRELKAYARITGFEMTFWFSKASDRITEKVKYHAIQIRECLKQLNRLASKDSHISEGVAKFHIEALLNLVKIVTDSSEELKNSLSVTDPQVNLRIQESNKVDSADEGSLDEACVP